MSKRLWGGEGKTKTEDEKRRQEILMGLLSNIGQVSWIKTKIFKNYFLVLGFLKMWLHDYVGSEFRVTHINIPFALGFLK